MRKKSIFHENAWKDILERSLFLVSKERLSLQKYLLSKYQRPFSTVCCCASSYISSLKQPHDEKVFCRSSSSSAQNSRSRRKSTIWDSFTDLNLSLLLLLLLLFLNSSFSGRNPKSSSRHDRFLFFNNSKNNNVYDYNWNSFNDEDFRRRFIIKTIVVVYVESVLLNACECHLHVL